MNPVWIFLILGLGLTWLVRWISPRGWARPGLKNVTLLALATAPWLAVASDLSRSETSVRELGPFALVVVFGLVFVEVCLLLRPRTYGSEGGAVGDPDDSAEDEVETPLSAEAKRLLERALGLEETPVDQLMTPREQVLTAQGGLTAGEVLEEMHRANRTRIVVVEGSVDRILGIAHAKDLVPLVLDGRQSEPVRRHMRRLHRVPRLISARRLLEEFRRHRVTIGAVADVRGRTLGLVGLNDVFRYIVTDAGDTRGRRTTNGGSGETDGSGEADGSREAGGSGEADASDRTAGTVGDTGGDAGDRTRAAHPIGAAGGSGTGAAEESPGQEGRSGAVGSGGSAGNTRP